MQETLPSLYDRLFYYEKTLSCSINNTKVKRPRSRDGTMIRGPYIKRPIKCAPRVPRKATPENTSITIFLLTGMEIGRKRAHMRRSMGRLLVCLSDSTNKKLSFTL